MMAAEFRAKIGSLESCFRGGDARDTELFDEDVWGEQHQAAHVVVIFDSGTGVKHCDGGAIAVADENGILDVQLRQEIWQCAQAFIVHVRDRARFGQQIGVAVAIARVDCHGASGGGRDARGEIFPVRDRTQAFVKEYELRGLRADAGDAFDFETVALHGDVENILLVTRGLVRAGIGWFHRFWLASLVHVIFSILPLRFILHRSCKIS